MRGAKISFIILLWSMSVGGAFYSGRITPREHQPNSLQSLEPAVSPQSHEATTARGSSLAESSFTAEELLTGADPTARAYRLSLVLKNTNEEQIRALLNQFLVAQPSVGRTQAITAIYRKWGTIAPESAMASLRDLPVREKRARQTDILVGWAMTDSEGAWAWAAENDPNVAISNAAVSSILEAGQPQVVRGLMNFLPDGRAKSGIAIALVEHLVAYDLDQALSLPNSLEPGVARANAIASIGRFIARESPDTAARFAFGLSDERDRGRTTIDVFGEWGAFGDLHAADAWLTGQPATNTKDIALGALIPAAILRDPGLASKLVHELRGSSQVRETTITRSVAALANISHSTAADWLVSTFQGNERTARLETLFTEWRKKDPAGAEQYLKHRPAQDER